MLYFPAILAKLDLKLIIWYINYPSERGEFMALEEFCAACTYMGERCLSDGKYYCERKGAYLYATTPKCGSFCQAYSRSDYARSNMYENSRDHQSSGCYITTIMCKKLGFSDNNYYLETLRKFRNKMQSNVNDLSLLVMYDQIGPKISAAIDQDDKGEEISLALFSRYIIPAVTAIENQKDQTAKDIYIAMTDVLAERYNINSNIVIPNKEEIVQENLGHGRMRIRKPQTNY